MVNVILKIKQYFCKHTDRQEIYRSYQDRFVQNVCKECGKIIYEDI